MKVTVTHHAANRYLERFGNVADPYAHVASLFEAARPARKRDLAMAFDRHRKRCDRRRVFFHEGSRLFFIAEQRRGLSIILTVFKPY